MRGEGAVKEMLPERNRGRLVRGWKRQGGAGGARGCPAGRWCLWVLNGAQAGAWDD